ncbi:MAG: Fe-S cluster assembly protein IscX [Chloroflexota bacterium]
MDTFSPEFLTWDDSYPIARRLLALYPHVQLEGVSLMDLYRWTIALPEFADDPELVNESILLSILQEWFEEANPL